MNLLIICVVAGLWSVSSARRPPKTPTQPPAPKSITCEAWKAKSNKCFRDSDLDEEEIAFALNPYALDHDDFPNACDIARDVLDCSKGLVKLARDNNVTESKDCTLKDDVYWWTSVAEFWNLICGPAEKVFMDSFICIQDYLENVDVKAADCVQKFPMEDKTRTKPEVVCDKIRFAISCVVKDVEQQCGKAAEQLIVRSKEKLFAHFDFIGLLCDAEVFNSKKE